MADTRKRSRWDAAGPSDAVALDGERPEADLSEEFRDEPAPHIDQHLPKSNRGYALMLKMGWSLGAGLGRSGQGIKEPVRIAEQYATLGLGKITEYDEYAVAATETRRAMTSEKIAAEDEGERAMREADAARQQGIADAVRRENATFYCEICDKQYAKVMEFENHLSSYDHHHKKRFRDMQQEQRQMARAIKEAAGAKKKERKDPALLAAEAAAKAAAKDVGVGISSAESSGSGSSNGMPLPPSHLPPPPPAPPLATQTSDAPTPQGVHALPTSSLGLGVTAAAPVKFGGMSLGASKLSGGARLGKGPQRKCGGLTKPSAFCDDDED